MVDSTTAFDQSVLGGRGDAGVTLDRVAMVIKIANISLTVSINGLSGEFAKMV
jgi:hypothetical protein